MKYKVGDIVRQYTDDRKIYWRGVVSYVGGERVGKTGGTLASDSYWIEWDNGSSNRVDEGRIEFDKEYLRGRRLEDLGI
jgi:hypothetical protein